MKIVPYFESELYQILDRYCDNWKNEPLDADEVDRLVYHLKNQLNFLNGNITDKEYLELERGE